MTNIASLYPPAPADVPADITKLPSAYRGRVVAMIGGLFVFLLLYLAIICAAGAIAYFLLVVMPMPGGGRGAIIYLIFKFGGALAMGMLCLFLVKGLFKGRRIERSSHIALHEEDHPELFAFIRKVYEDTGSRRPRRVYVSPEVNAALIYDTSLLNLFIPPRKDLLIGMGLVNVVNLVEFKAVLAHEFGHFAQKSVGFGSYLYVANQVMQDVIYSRDGLDRFVDQWASIDIRISFPAWGLKGLLWVVRKILSGMYRSLNLLHLSLSRQMEFNADNVAVSVTGSDAIVHCLARLEFANEALADAAQSLNAAADHGMFTDDLFYHQTKSAERIRKLRKDERIGLPPALPDDSETKVEVFAFVDDGMPDKFRSHPTDHMREKNAKRIYIRSPQDDRSPWILFGDARPLKRLVTEIFYRHTLERRERVEPRPAKEVQDFIDAEHIETTYDSKYHGWYDDRFINPGDLELLPPSPWQHDRIAEWLADWPPKDLESQVQAYRERQNELNLLQGLESGNLQLKGSTFPFRGRDRTLRDVKRLTKEVDDELTADVEAFHKKDREVFLAHWSIARDLDRAAESSSREAELLERYRFHTKLQPLLQGMIGEQNRLQAIVSFMANNPQMQEGDFNAVRDGLAEIHQALRDNLNDAKKFHTPALTNVPAGSILFDLIVDRGDRRLERLEGNQISYDWVRKLITRIDGVVSRVRRLHFKSLGSMLALQDKLAREWTETSNVALSPPTVSESLS